MGPVPLSTSSSDQRLPALAYRLLWVAALAFSLVLFAGAEALLRRAGHLPSITDSQALWSLHLDRALQQTNGIILAGASQAQLGISVDDFERETGRALANLTINGNSPLPLVKYLAEETDFRGTLLIDVLEPHGATHYKDSTTTQYIHYYQTSKGSGALLNPLVNQLILNGLQRSWVFFSANVRLPSVLGNRPPFYVQTLPTRTKRAFYRTMVSPASQPRPPQPPLPFSDDEWAQWKATVKDMGAWVARIQARQGRVVFICFPRRAGAYDEQFPRALYWDYLVSQVPAASIHFADYPALLRFELPDGLHVDAADAPAFTRELTRILAQNHLF